MTAYVEMRHSALRSAYYTVTQSGTLDKAV